MTVLGPLSSNHKGAPDRVSERWCSTATTAQCKHCTVLGHADVVCMEHWRRIQLLIMPSCNCTSCVTAPWFSRPCVGLEHSMLCTSFPSLRLSQGHLEPNFRCCFMSNRHSCHICPADGRAAWGPEGHSCKRRLPARLHPRLRAS